MRKLLIDGYLVEVEVDLKVDGTSLILSPADEKRLLDCIRSMPKPPVNGRISLTVVVETIRSSDASKVSNKPDTTVPTRT